MNIDNFYAAATLVGFITMLIGLAALGSAGLSVISRFLLRRQAGANCIVTPDMEFCITHDCGAFEQCLKDGCPHCGFSQRLTKAIEEEEAACHPGCDNENPEDCRKLRVRFVEPQTVEWESDTEGILEVREHMSNGDVIHYTRSGVTHEGPVVSKLEGIFESVPEAPERGGCGGRDCCGGVES